MRDSYYIITNKKQKISLLTKKGITKEILYISYQQSAMAG